MGIQKRIGIVFALEQERRGLDRVLTNARVVTRCRDGLSWWATGRIEIVATVSGVGGERSAEATGLLLDHGAESIVCAGFAAGLDPELQVGDVLVAGRVLDGEPSADPAVECNAIELGSALIDIGYSVRLGDLVSWHSVVRTRSEKAEIRGRTGALALDMESFGAGLVCRERGISFAAIRSISDTVDDELPREVEALAAARSTIGRLAIAASSPRAWPALVRLRRQARIAAGNLGDLLGFQIVGIGRNGVRPLR